MRKTFNLIAFLLVGIFLFSSCHKEGQYLPKKKLNKIERASITDAGTIVSEIEEWQWDGKLLSSIITKTGSGDLISTVNFKYDSKKRIESLHVKYSQYSNDFKFIYEGKDLVKITRVNEEFDEEDVYTFKKIDGNVTEITLSPVESKSMTGLNILRFVLPSEVADQIKPSSTKATTTYKLTWDGNNVTKMETYSNGVLSVTNTWKHDDMINPLNGLYTDNSLRTIEGLYSANNVIEETTVLMIMGMETIIQNKYEYKYDDKYPTERTWNVESLGISMKRIETYYYN